MINPNKVHKDKGIIISIPKGLYQTYQVKLIRNGAIIEGYDLPKRFKLNDKVNIQASYSIVVEQYLIRAIRKARS